jgi:hypothetical protein
MKRLIFAEKIEKKRQSKGLSQIWIRFKVFCQKRAKIVIFKSRGQKSYYQNIRKSFFKIFGAKQFLILFIVNLYKTGEPIKIKILNFLKSLHLNVLND